MALHTRSRWYLRRIDAASPILTTDAQLAIERLMGCPGLGTAPAPHPAKFTSQRVVYGSDTLSGHQGR